MAIKMILEMTMTKEQSILQMQVRRAKATLERLLASSESDAQIMDAMEELAFCDAALKRGGAND